MIPIPPKKSKNMLMLSKKILLWLSQLLKNVMLPIIFSSCTDWAVAMTKRKSLCRFLTFRNTWHSKRNTNNTGVDGPFRKSFGWRKFATFWSDENGDFPEGSHVLRAKIDMVSKNMLMRDPWWQSFASLMNRKRQQNLSNVHGAHGRKVIISNKFRILICTL
jgi:glutaminyl-tRNA synthetase